jgi:hypothetical protein
MTQPARTIAATLSALSLAVLGLGALSACSATPGPVAPTGAGTYMLTVLDATSGRPVEGVELVASASGARFSGTAASSATTDEDGIAVLRFGNWGAVELRVTQDDSAERWLVTQDRVAVNGGKSSIEPLRMMVGSRRQGGASAFALSITRVERGGKIDAN